jgi:hypothetical protein
MLNPAGESMLMSMIGSLLMAVPWLQSRRAQPRARFDSETGCRMRPGEAPSSYFDSRRWKKRSAHCHRAVIAR